MPEIFATRAARSTIHNSFDDRGGIESWPQPSHSVGFLAFVLAMGVTQIVLGRGRDGGISAWHIGHMRALADYFGTSKERSLILQDVRLIDTARQIWVCADGNYR